MTSWVDEIVKTYPKDVKFVFKQFPLPMHPQAKLAAQATLAGHNQGKFWPIHDKLFANFRTINRDNILLWAKEAGLDMAKFTKDLDDPKTIAAVDKDTADGQKIGVNGTPAFFINGKRYNGARSMEGIKPHIEAELKAPARTATDKPAADKPKAPAKDAATKPVKP